MQFFKCRVFLRQHFNEALRNLQAHIAVGQRKSVSCLQDGCITSPPNEEKVVDLSPRVIINEHNKWCFKFSVCSFSLDGERRRRLRYRQLYLGGITTGADKHVFRTTHLFETRCRISGENWLAPNELSISYDGFGCWKTIATLPELTNRRKFKKAASVNNTLALIVTVYGTDFPRHAS